MAACSLSQKGQTSLDAFVRGPGAAGPGGSEGHWWQRSPGASQCPLSAARAWQCPFSAARAWQCPLSAARPCSARSLRPAPGSARSLRPAPAAPAAPSFGFCPPRPWPLAVVLLLDLPCSHRHQHSLLTVALLEEAPEAQQSPGHRLQGRGRQTRPPSCGPPVPAPVLQLELGQSPQDLGKSRPRRGASRRQTHTWRRTRCAAGRVPLGGRGAGPAPGGPCARLVALEDWPMAMGPAGQAGPL